MEESVARELKSLSRHFPKWADTMRKHEEQIYQTDVEEVSDDAVQTELEVHEICRTILGVCTRCGHFRDTWDPGTLMQFPFGQQTTMKSQKTGAEIALGCSHRDIFLSSYLNSPEHIKSMTDEFWACFIELQSLGDFRFLENALPSSQEAHRIMKHSKNAKSNIFQIIRNYLLLEACQQGSDDLGSLEIKWPSTMPWSEMIENAVKAFGRLHKINYLLYRGEYIRRKGRQP